MTRRVIKQIAALESELLARLVAGLRRDASRVFFTSRIVDAHAWPPSLRAPLADELSEAAERLVHLYAQEGIDPADTPAARYLAARGRCTDLANPHRASPDAEAQRLLHALNTASRNDRE